MVNRNEYLSSLREKGRTMNISSSRKWGDRVRYRKENSKQINRIQTKQGTVREEHMQKHINPLKTIRKCTSTRGGTRKRYGTKCRKHHRHTKSCRR
jgi:hypothetical protein